MRLDMIAICEELKDCTQLHRKVRIGTKRLDKHADDNREVSHWAGLICDLNENDKVRENEDKLYPREMRKGKPILFIFFITKYFFYDIRIKGFFMVS